MQLNEAIQAKFLLGQNLSSSLENRRWFVRTYIAEYTYLSTLDPNTFDAVQKLRFQGLPNWITREQSKCYLLERQISILYWEINRLIIERDRQE